MKSVFVAFVLLASLTVSTFAQGKSYAEIGCFGTYASGGKSFSPLYTNVGLNLKFKNYMSGATTPFGLSFQASQNDWKPSSMLAGLTYSPVDFCDIFAGAGGVYTADKNGIARVALGTEFKFDSYYFRASAMGYPRDDFDYQLQAMFSLFPNKVPDGAYLGVVAQRYLGIGPLLAYNAIPGMLGIKLGYCYDFERQAVNITWSLYTPF